MSSQPSRKRSKRPHEETDAAIGTLDAEHELLTRCRLHLQHKIKRLEEDAAALRARLPPGAGTLVAPPPAAAARTPPVELIWRTAGNVATGLSSSDEDDEALDAARAHIEAAAKAPDYFRAPSRAPVSDDDALDDEDDEDFLDDDDEAEASRLQQLAASARSRRQQEEGRAPPQAADAAGRALLPEP